MKRLIILAALLSLAAPAHADVVEVIHGSLDAPSSVMFPNSAPVAKVQLSKKQRVKRAAVATFHAAEFTARHPVAAVKNAGKAAYHGCCKAGEWNERSHFGSFCSLLGVAAMGVTAIRK